MQWYDNVTPFLDLTNLKSEASIDSILELCEQALAAKVAGVCILPPALPTAVKALQHTAIRIVTVANFPDGNSQIRNVLEDMQSSLAHGAQEIDLVFPYTRFLNGDVQFAIDLITAARSLDADMCLKVILETGALQLDNHIENAARIALQCGADFIKTSTGKNHPGASIPAVSSMLRILKEFAAQPRGLKVSGGIRTLAQAHEYCALAADHMSKDWLVPAHFRIGTSTLF